ncbi:MAG: Na+/H+ antiporter NhaC family protein [Longimicrobiales bacterium]|nr:Na+/H+ antiporter NhaC family protein [Longimicrobiales bacterium]
MTDLFFERAPDEELRFSGGWPGALAPFAVFLGGVSWLGLSGAPDETGFLPVLLMALGVGLLLARDREGYAEAVLDGMSHRLVMLLVLAWLLAGVLGTVLQASGLVEALVWAAAVSEVGGGGFVIATFLVCAVFSTATGTSLGTILICAPLLFPAAAPLGGDPAFTIGAILAGATFGDNLSPISDTTIASATTQGADLGGVVRSRLRYALPAGALAIVVYGVAGGTGPSDVGGVHVTGTPSALLMLTVPALVLVLLLRRSHLAVGLFAGIGAALGLGLLLRRFGPADLLAVDPDAFVASGILLDGMSRAFGVSMFTILLMGMVGGLQASGLLRRIVRWMEDRARSGSGAGWWIFTSISLATILTTHSAVAILTVGPLARSLGEESGLDGYRRANILDVTVCTYPFLLPFFIPTILAASMTGGPGSTAVSPWTAGLYNAHSWGLLLVLLASLVWPRYATR